MNYNTKLFIEKNINLIEGNNFKELYKLSEEGTEHPVEPGLVTYVLIEAGIDPLDYLDYIPWRYYSFSPFETFIVPDHIKYIEGGGVVAESSIKTIVIPRSVKYVGEGAFDYVYDNLKEIQYKGTAEEFLNIENIKQAAHWDLTVVCTDKELNLWENPAV